MRCSGPLSAAAQVNWFHTMATQNMFMWFHSLLPILATLRSVRTRRQIRQVRGRSFPLYNPAL